MKYLLPLVPDHDIKNGLVAVFDRETDTGTQISFADIKAGDTVFELPPSDGRKLIGVYQLIPLSPAEEPESAS